MHRIAIINAKGGTGKTTTAINLAAALADRGRRVLLVDMDPQSHCSLGLSVPESAITDTLSQALTRGLRPGPELTEGLWQVSSNLFLAPSPRQMWRALSVVGQKPDGHRRLNQALDRIIEDFEVCIIDTPPSLGLFTQNALRAAQRIIVPVEPGYFSMRQATEAPATLRAMASGLSHRVEVYLLPTMQPEGEQTNNERLQVLADKARAIVLSPIRYCDQILEAQRRGQPITEVAPESHGAEDYHRLAREALSALPSIQSVEPAEGDSALEPVTTAAAQQPPVGFNKAHTNLDNKATARSRERLQISEPQAPAEQPVPGAGASERVLELVRRARSLAERNARMREDKERREAELNEQNESRSTSRAKLNKRYGVTVTRQGTIFIQPDNGADEVALVGDFNDWNNSATPMKRNAELGVWEICIPLEPGQYHYNIVVDGKPSPDPHHNIAVNDNGRTVSLLNVR